MNYRGGHWTDECKGNGPDHCIWIDIIPRLYSELYTCKSDELYDLSGDKVYVPRYGFWECRPYIWWCSNYEGYWWMYDFGFVNSVVGLEVPYEKGLLMGSLKVLIMIIWLYYNGEVIRLSIQL